MDVYLAESAGCCFGVKRAINMALETAAGQNGPIYMLGDIVHNEHVVRQIEQASVQVVASLEQIPAGTLLIRAHGAVPDVYDTARRKGLTIIDATCPLVLEIHKIARDLEQQGYTMIIIGDHGHDEVVGIAGHLQSSVVVSTSEEALQLERASRIGVVVQSTQNIEDVQHIIAILAGKCRELRFVNTICPATTARQRDIRQLPQDYDAVIIIGSYTSANTCRLREISQTINPNTYQIESADDLCPEWIDGVSSVAVSAGASTPDNVIRAVLDKLESL